LVFHVKRWSLTELKRLQLRIKELEIEILNLVRDLRMAKENESLLMKYIMELEKKLQVAEVKKHFRTKDR